MSRRRSRPLDAAAERPDLEALKGCPGPHMFQLEAAAGEVSSRARYRCSVCGGRLSGDRAEWYTRGVIAGLRAARKGAAE